MDDAEMHAANLAAIIVQQRDDAVVECGSNADFLVDFTLNSAPVSFFVPGEERFVMIVQMAADADRAFGNQALFTGLFPTHIMEDAIAMRDDRIGNDLLVVRIDLGGSA